MQAGKDFVQEGVSLERVQGIPYQKPKTPLIWPTIFGKLCNLFSLFGNYFTFSISDKRGGTSPLGCIPAAGRINSGKIHYVMILALNATY